MSASLLGLPDESSVDQGTASGPPRSAKTEELTEFEKVAEYLAATESAEDIQVRIVETARAIPSVEWAELATLRPDGTVVCAVKDGCACRTLQPGPIRDAITRTRQSLLLEEMVLAGTGEKVLVLPLVERGTSGDVLVLGLREKLSPDQVDLHHFAAFARLAAQALELWHLDQSLIRGHKTLEAAIARRTLELERQREFDRTLLETLGTGVIACDEAGRLVLFNRTSREWHGLGPVNIPQEEWASFYDLCEADGMTPLTPDRIPLVRALRGEEVHGVPIVLRPKHQHPRLVSCTGTQLRGADGALLGAVLLMDDITQQTNASKEIREANVRLRELLQRTEELARKAEMANEAKSEFLATMSHELRTPMSGVLGMADLLSMTQLDAEQRSCLELIRSSGESLLALINGILDFSKIEAGQIDLDFHDFQLAPFLRKLADTYGATAAAKGLSLRLDCEQGLPEWLHADAERLHQVLGNLLNNAVKFTDQGGITLSVTRSDETTDWVSLRFAVQDTGIGIPPEKRDLLFQRFSQIDSSDTRKHGGTGLGLAISKHLVELFGGSMGVNSPPSSTTDGGAAPRGSEFWFTVRLAKGRPGTEPPPPTRAHRPFSCKHRVLVVEDNPVNRRMLVSMLQKLGLESEWAGNGQAALDRLNRSQFDLILMDLQMPVMGGEQAARRIRALPEKHPARAVPIIAVSAHAFAEDKLRCLQAGMNDHVTKPIQMSQLEAALHQWLERPAERS